MLSPLQERKISRMFDVLDVDRDGFLSPADTDRVVLRLAKQRNWTQGGPEHRALRQAYEPAVHALDPFRDSAGRVDLANYLRYHSGMLEVPHAYQQAIRGVADLVFDALDADDDGRVTETEMGQFFRAYSIEPELAPGAFRKIDADDDGKISKSELLDAVSQFYLSSDPDAPGNWLLGKF